MNQHLLKKMLKKDFFQVFLFIYNFLAILFVSNIIFLDTEKEEIILTLGTFEYTVPILPRSYRETNVSIWLLTRI